MPHPNSRPQDWHARPTSTHVVIGLVLIIATLMTLKYFPGLENEPNYAGAAIQTIHPELFAGDPYRGPEFGMGSRILQLSLFYGLVKVFGDIWLDDRFIAAMYLGFVVLGLIGVDKTARLLGANELYQRAVILLLFAKDHAILDNKVLLAHHQGFNHSVIAIPLIVWLFYTVLARKGLVTVLVLSIILLATSVRYAPIPIVTAMLAVFAIGSRGERWAVGLLSVLGLATSYWVLNVAMAVPDEGRIALWHILLDAAGGDVNPFHDAFSSFSAFLLKNSLYLAMLLGAAVLVPKNSQISVGVKVIMAMGALTWLLGGLYLSFAPDAVKYPLLQGIAPTRALAWPQNLAYIAIFVAGLRQITHHQNARNTSLVVLCLTALFLIGPGNHELWAGVLAIASVAVLGAHSIMVRRNAQSLPVYIVNHTTKIMAQTMALALLVAYGSGVYNQLPAWRTNMTTGVYGNAMPAAWIGIAEYFRDRTPNGTVVLPISYREPRLRLTPPNIGPNDKVPKISIDRSLGTRSGRAMPIPEDFPGNFRNPESWVKGKAQSQIVENIEKSLSIRDHCNAARQIAKLVPVPEYVVLPTALLPTHKSLGRYKLEREIRSYAITKRTDEDLTQCPTQ